MRDLSTFSLNQGENIIEKFPNVSLQVRRKKRSYSRTGEVILTSDRIACLVYSRLGGVKEAFDCNYFDIEAVRTQSDFNVYGGLAVYSRDGEAFHAGFFRNHLRAMQIFFNIINCAGYELKTRENVLRRLGACTFDFIVPQDAYDSLPDETISNLQDYGILMHPSCQTVLISNSERAMVAEQDSGGSTNKETAGSESLIGCISLDELQSQDFTYSVQKKYSPEGEYIEMDEKIMLIKPTSKQLPIIVITPKSGFVHWLHAKSNEQYHSSERYVQVLDKPKENNSLSVDTKANFRSSQGIDKYMTELDSLVGLEQVKKEVRQLVSLIQIQQERESLGISSQPMNQHMVFIGSPGTGKTTVARILGGLFKELGILSKGHFIEVDRSGLVAGYLGQTAIKTLAVLKSCLGGVLFIDEAYSLASTKGVEVDQFGDEAIDTLLKFMEDNRDNFVVIVAGYTVEMNQFLTSNPGLKSRFNTFVLFDDYSEHELLEILYRSAKSFNYRIDSGAVKDIKRILSRLCYSRGLNFGNARSMRNLLEISIKRQAHRLASKVNRSKDDLQLLTREDFLIEEDKLSDI
jgi:stage V sporulation protein K